MKLKTKTQLEKNKPKSGSLERATDLIKNSRNTKESKSEVAQSCPTLCGPLDGSPPGSSVHGILQARTLEWAATSYSIYRGEVQYV